MRQNWNRLTGYIIILLPIFCMWLYAASLPLLSSLVGHNLLRANNIQVTWVDWLHSNSSAVISKNISKVDLPFVQEKKLKLSLYEHAVKVSPLNAEYWLNLSDVYISYGQLEKSKRALAFVEKLGWNHVHFLKSVLAGYLYHDDKVAIYKIARRIIELSPKESALLYVALTLNMSDTHFFKNILYSGDLNYSTIQESLKSILGTVNLSAFRNKTKKNNITISMAWEYSDMEVKKWLVQTNLIDLPLLQNKSYIKLNQLSKSLNDAIFYQGGNLTLGFKDNILDQAFCWQDKFRSDQINIEHTKYDDNYKIQFLPREQSRLDFVFSCYLPINLEQEKKVRLRGQWSGENSGSVQTPVQFNVIIYDKNSRRLGIKQHGSWKDESIDIDIPLTPMTTGLRLYFRIIQSFQSSNDFSSLKLHQFILSEKSIN